MSALGSILTADPKQEFKAFHRDCYQILLLNFRSSTETVNLEDSQIDFATERFFALGGAGGVGGREGLHKNVSQILATIDFSCEEIGGKSLSV